MYTVSSTASLAGMRFFVVVFALFSLAAAASINDVFGYILKHPTQCGDPFAQDKEWIPAHKFCSTDCDHNTHMCFKAVKGEKQKCDKLPEACIKGIKHL